MSEVIKCRQAVMLEGKGKTKQAAFADALNKVSKSVCEEQKVVLRIEPLDIQILSAEKNQYDERFLFFFMPRKRVEYCVTLKIEVEILLIEAEKVVFKEKNRKSPDTIQLPFLSRRQF